MTRIVPLPLALTLALAATPAPALAAGAFSAAFEAARAHDAAYRAARHELEAGEELVPIARAGLLPSVTASFSESRVRGEREYAPPSPKNDLDYRNPVFALQLRAPLFNLEAYSRYAAAQAQTEGARARFAAGGRELLDRLGLAYVQRLFAEETLALARVQVDALETQTTIARRRLGAGEGTRTELADAEASLASARAERIAADEKRLAAFADAEGIQAWIQPAGPDSARPLHPAGAQSPFYTLPEFGLRLDFRPTDFTQVNVDINRLLIRRSMQLLDPRPGERIADLFCGLGNFSLPIARLGAEVVGVEGSEALVERAHANAARNGLAALCEFHAANLFETTEDSLAALGRLDKLLIDPPREGAIAVVKAIDPSRGPARIVYVSCNPATLARDAAVLVHEKGYRLAAAGIANMFPQTSHVESVALFERESEGRAGFD